MADVRKEVKAVLQSFGFDEFMAGQVFERLRIQGLIVTEPLGDSISTVLQTLEDQGWELHEVHSAVEAMQEAGIVFRER
jgi:hypothetical protein